MLHQSNLPRAAGVGFKPQHFGDIVSGEQPIGFVEIHAENYMGLGGAPHAQLRALCERYALSVHGVGLSIGSMAPLDLDHLARLRTLCERYQPASFSEHLAWSSHGEVYLNDLLPLPYTQETLDRIVSHIDQVQETLAREMLLENPSTYLQFEDSTIPETEFLADIASLTRIVVPQDVVIRPAEQQVQRFVGDTAGALLYGAFTIRTFVKSARATPAANATQ